VLLSFFIFVANILKAQTGIGTSTPNASAKLDVYATDKGFLPPRVALTGTTDLTTIKNSLGVSITPATGLLVYNTATAGTSPNNVIPGYYYYSGTTWVSLSPKTASISLNNQASTVTNYTLSSLDNGTVITFTATSAITVTVPYNTLPAGFICQIIQSGSGGQITITPATSMTLNGAMGLKTRTLYSAIGIILQSSTVGFITGDTTF
jgi:hypothetical protein